MQNLKLNTNLIYLFCVQNIQTLKVKRAPFLLKIVKDFDIDD
jgi:hypothetical protein